tara:strand:+ start:5256 stop:6479 length:1224 start_codon:yes stop_codon:yes gene_type:complete
MKILKIISVLILIFSTLRFLILFALNINVSSSINYLSTTILFVLIIIFSKPVTVFYERSKNYLYQIILLNFFAGILWFSTSFLINGFSIGSVREFLIIFVAPFSILIFLNVTKSTITNTVKFIVFIISLSCLLDFTVSNFFPGGIIGAEIKNYYLMKITPPETQIVPARIGILVRSHGITGSYHDSANILTFTLIFLIGNFFKNKSQKILNMLLIFVGVLALITTLSLANIIAFFVGLLIINFSRAKYLIPRTILSFGFVYVILFFFNSYFNLFEYILPQLDPSGVKFQAMLATGTSTAFQNIISFIFGHENLTNISNVGYFSEAAFVVLLSNLGIIPFFTLMFLLVYPIYSYFKFNSGQYNLYNVIAVSIAILTLWHYGSLFRSTSIFIFYAIYALSIKRIKEVND